jgi:decaprenyl-phosphate phosphoribosyltransferase
LLRLARPRQWVKNAFVLAPLLFAGGFLQAPVVMQALIATALFCVASSMTYIFNDIGDLEKDRLHPIKSKKRPLAARTISLTTAWVTLVGLGLVLMVGWWWHPATMGVIMGYLALNLAYTHGLKHQPVLDIFSIALGFVLRVWAGAVAISSPLSSWMFITTLCLALYLAAIKRRQELVQAGQGARTVLKHYTVALVDRYAEMSATGALMFYSMFVMSEKPLLAPTIPLVLFGLFRYWYVVEKNGAGESPTDALLTDWPLLLVIVGWVAVCAWELWPT